MVMTTAVALLSSGGGSDCSWQAAGDGDELETSFVAKHHSGLKSTRALNPLAIQHSYSAEKSAVETAGCGVGQTGPSMLAHTPPLTTLAHMAVGETREIRGRGET